MRFLLASILMPVCVWASDPIVKSSHPIEGTWALKSKSCSSGAPVRGPWNPRHDFFEMTFDYNRLVEESQVGGCRYKVESLFEAQEPILSIYPRFYWSSCGPLQLPTKINYSYAISGDLLKLHAPMNGPGGACPAGDVLQGTFQKVPAAQP